MISHVGCRSLRIARVAVLALAAWLAAPVAVTADSPPLPPLPPVLRDSAPQVLLAGPQRKDPRWRGAAVEQAALLSLIHI